MELQADVSSKKSLRINAFNTYFHRQHHEHFAQYTPVFTSPDMKTVIQSIRPLEWASVGGMALFSNGVYWLQSGNYGNAVRWVVRPIVVVALTAMVFRNQLGKSYFRLVGIDENEREHKLWGYPKGERKLKQIVYHPAFQPRKTTQMEYNHLDNLSYQLCEGYLEMYPEVKKYMVEKGLSIDDVAIDYDKFVPYKARHPNESRQHNELRENSWMSPHDERRKKFNMPYLHQKAMEEERKLRDQL